MYLMADADRPSFDARVLPRLVREPEPSCGDRAGDIVGFHRRDIVPELGERPADLAREARLDRLFQVGIALAHDLVHDRGLHPGGLELGKRLARVHRVELLGVADQHHAGDAKLVGDPEQVPRLHRGGERALIDHQDGLREDRAHLPDAPGREPALGHAGVAGKEALQVSDSIPASEASVCTAEAEGARPIVRQPFFSASVRARSSIVVLPVPA